MRKACLRAAVGTSLLLAVVTPASAARAQEQGFEIVPPPPRIEREPGSGKGVHQAEFDPADPTRAFDQETGQNLHWDCARKTWVDSATGRAMGFQGRRAASGEIIPPPPRIEREPGSGRGIRQAEFDPADPARAFDAETGQNLHWDRTAGTWKDSKTGQSLGFQGGRARTRCQTGATTPPPPPPPVRTDGSTGALPREPRTDGLYAGLGATWFNENSIDIGLATGTVGYAFTPNIAVEGELSVGVIDETNDNGTFRDSTGIAWSAIPFAVGRLPLSDDVALFGRAGYGWRRFDFSLQGPGVNVDSAGTEGLLAFGGGIEVGVTDDVSARLSYTREEYDNGSEANAFGLALTTRLGRPSE